MDNQFNVMESLMSGDSGKGYVFRLKKQISYWLIMDWSLYQPKMAEI